MRSLSLRTGFVYMNRSNCDRKNIKIQFEELNKICFILVLRKNTRDFPVLYVI